MAGDPASPITKDALLVEMEAIWRDLDAELGAFDPARLDARMPIDAPAWTGRQLLGHLLGALQSNPYYLAQPRGGAVVETVIGDPYWRQIYATATLDSFRAMLFAAHAGMVALLAAADEADLQRVAPYAQRGQGSAADTIWFNYHVHLRSHVADLQRWNERISET